MKGSKHYLFALAVITFLFGCSQPNNPLNNPVIPIGAQTPAPLVTPAPRTIDQLISGKWESDCFDIFGGSAARNRLIGIYVPDPTTTDVTITHQVATYANVGCRGALILPQPLREYSISNVAVTGIPQDFYVAKLTHHGSVQSIYYLVVRLTPGKMDVLTGPFTTPHNNWSSWLREANVVGFVADPTNFRTNSIFGVRHFNGIPLE